MARPNGSTLLLRFSTDLISLTFSTIFHFRSFFQLYFAVNFYIQLLLKKNYENQNLLWRIRLG